MVQSVWSWANQNERDLALSICEKGLTFGLHTSLGSSKIS